MLYVDWAEIFEAQNKQRRQMKKGLTSQWTTMTLTNEDEAKMLVYHMELDDSAMAIKIGDEEFWFEKSDAELIIQALEMISKA